MLDRGKCPQPLAHQCRRLSLLLLDLQMALCVLMDLSCLLIGMATSIPAKNCTTWDFVVHFWCSHWADIEYPSFLCVCMRVYKQTPTYQTNIRKNRETYKAKPLSLHLPKHSPPSQQQAMMMIAFITINSGAVLLIEGLCAQILYFRFEIIGGLRSHLLLFLFRK